MNAHPNHNETQSDIIDPREFCSLSGTPLFWDWKPKNLLRHITGRADVVCAVACGLVLVATALCSPAKAQKIMEGVIGLVPELFVLVTARACVAKTDLPELIDGRAVVYKGKAHTMESRIKGLRPQKVTLGARHKTYWESMWSLFQGTSAALALFVGASFCINPSTMPAVMGFFVFAAQRLQKSECQMKLAAREWSLVVMPSRQQSNAQQDAPKLTK